MDEYLFSEDEVMAFAKEAYENGKASFPVIKGNCALLVIDMQKEFVKPGWAPSWVPEATRQVGRIKSLIEHCRSNSVPVIYTVFSRTNNYLDRPNSGLFMPNRYKAMKTAERKYFINGEVWPELAPQENEIVIHKPSYGAFYDTPLETILKNLRKDTVIICGTLTNYCCGTTARQAYERGFKVVFGSDITSTDDPSLQEPELKVLRKGFALVLDNESIIKALS